MRAIRKSTLIILASLVVSTFSIQARSQATYDFDRLRDAIERNAELLEKAKELVRDTNSIKARASLQTATRLHEESQMLLNEYDKQGEPKKLLLAGQVMRKTREVLLRTIALAKEEAKLEENAWRAIERASVHLDQARQLQEAHASSGTIPARKLTDEARGQLQRARDNMREHRFEIAFRLATSSAELSTRAINLLKRDFASPEAVRREIEKTERVMERIRDEMQGNLAPAVSRLVHEAQELQGKAKDHFDGGRYRPALDMTQKARDIAMRVLKHLASTADSESVEDALRLTDMLIDEARRVVAERGLDDAAHRIRAAEELQKNARDQYRLGHFDRALKATRSARNVLKDALAAIRTDLSEDEVRAALQATDDALAELRDAVSDSNDSTAAELFDEAKSQQERGWKAFEERKLKAALTRTRLARNLARRALQHLNDGRI